MTSSLQTRGASTPSAHRARQGNRSAREDTPTERFIRRTWAALFAALAGLRISGFIAPAALLSAPAAPGTIRHILGAKLRWPRLIIVMIGIMWASAPLTTLAGLAVDPERAWSLREGAKDVIQYGSLTLILLGVYWACQQLRAQWVMALFALGILARYALRPDISTGLADLVKFRIGPTLPLIALALTARAPRWAQALVLAATAGMGAWSNLRATLVAALVALFMLGMSWVLSHAQGAAQSERRTGTIVAAIAGAALVGLSTFTLFPQLASEGYFGQDIQTRTSEDASNEAGFLGARIEPGASLSLASRTPTGLGPGVIPSDADESAAWNGLIAIGVDPSGGDFNANYMRDIVQGRIFLHSNLAETWWKFGLPGAALILSFAALVARGLIRQTLESRPYLSGMILYLTARSLWDCFFEPVTPIGTNLWATVGLLLALEVQQDAPRRRAALDATHRTQGRYKALRAAPDGRARQPKR